MKYSYEFLKDFNTRDCVQHGHDPRNHIGFNTGLINGDLVDAWWSLWMHGKEHDKVN